MSPRFRPRRVEPEALERPPHEVVRDYPEALAVFRARSFPFARDGARPLSETAPTGESEEEGTLFDALRDAVSWRERADG